MPKTLLIVLIFCFGCSKDKGFILLPSNQDKVIGRVWQAYEFTHNGTLLNISNQQIIFELRNDARLYISRINPVIKDTMLFLFINETNIQLSKPWTIANDVSNLRIDRITDTDFDFTLTNNKNPDIDFYKTQKQ